VGESPYVVGFFGFGFCCCDLFGCQPGCEGLPCSHLSESRSIAGIVVVPFAHFFGYQLVAQPWFVCDVISVRLNDVGFYFFEGGEKFISVELFPVEFKFKVGTILFCEVGADILVVFIFGVESSSIYDVVDLLSTVRVPN
jgi:hypothetical protein